MHAQTSLEAYQNMQPKIKTDHDKILAALKPNKGMTYNEIARYIGWYNPVKVARRIPELLRDGKIRKLEVRKCTIAKSNCNTYVKI